MWRLSFDKYGMFNFLYQSMVNDSSVSQFQLIVCGLGKIDIHDWKSNTRLKHCTADSNIVKWFWRAVESYDEEKRARLLQFVTGSSRVPLQGFKALQGTWCPLAWLSHSGSRTDNHTCVCSETLYDPGAAGPRLFTIHQIDASSNNLPKAHTWWAHFCRPVLNQYGFYKGQCLWNI